MRIIQGPTAPLTAGSIIYQITLASGMIITNPSEFGLDGQNQYLPQSINVSHVYFRTVLCVGNAQIGTNVLTNE